MNRTIRSCALRSVTILGYVRAAIVYSPLAFEEAENKLYSNSHHPLNNAEKICILLCRTKATNFANGRSIDCANVDRVAFVATNGDEFAILITQENINVFTTRAGCVVEDGIAWLGCIATIGWVPATSRAIVRFEAAHARDAPATIVWVDKWHTRLLVHPADEIRTPILSLALAVECTRLWSVKLLVSNRDDLRSDGRQLLRIYCWELLFLPKLLERIGLHTAWYKKQSTIYNSTAQYNRKHNPERKQSKALPGERCGLME